MYTNCAKGQISNLFFSKVRKCVKRWLFLTINLRTAESIGKSTKKTAKLRFYLFLAVPMGLLTPPCKILLLAKPAYFRLPFCYGSNPMPHVFDSRHSQKKQIAPQRCALFFGSPNGNRTHVTGMRIRCPNRQTMGPKHASILTILFYFSISFVDEGKNNLAFAQNIRYLFLIVFTGENNV